MQARGSSRLLVGSRPQLVVGLVDAYSQSSLSLVGSWPQLAVGLVDG